MQGLEVLRVPGIECAVAFPVLASSFTDVANGFVQTRRYVGGRQMIEIAFVGRLRDLGAPVQITNALAHLLPGCRTRRIVVGVSIDLESTRPVDGGFST